MVRRSAEIHDVVTGDANIRGLRQLFQNPKTPERQKHVLAGRDIVLRHQDLDSEAGLVDRNALKLQCKIDVAFPVKRKRNIAILLQFGYEHQRQIISTPVLLPEITVVDQHLFFRLPVHVLLKLLRCCAKRSRYGQRFSCFSCRTARNNTGKTIPSTTATPDNGQKHAPTIHAPVRLSRHNSATF